ncbi:hypothetical protein OLF92_11520, partial [Streptococcus pneumoniae]|nr:hypothetical protein [Streptococcus pneumoniae]
SDGPGASDSVDSSEEVRGAVDGVESSGGVEESESSVDEVVAEHQLPLNGLRGYTTRRSP